MQGTNVDTLGFLGMRHAVTRSHQVQLTWTNELFGSQTVAMQNRSFQEPSHRLQSDMRVRSDIETAILVDDPGPHTVDKTPGADRLLSALRRYSSYCETTNSRFARHEHLHTARYPRKDVMFGLRMMITITIVGALDDRTVL